MIRCYKDTHRDHRCNPAPGRYNSSVEQVEQHASYDSANDCPDTYQTNDSRGIEHSETFLDEDWYSVDAQTGGSYRIEQCRCRHSEVAKRHIFVPGFRLQGRHPGAESDPLVGVIPIEQEQHQWKDHDETDDAKGHVGTSPAECLDQSGCKEWNDC